MLIYQFRYHVPAHVRPHIDYITPGIKLFAAGKGRRGSKGLEKRTIRNHPPLKAALPMPMSDIVASITSDAPLAICDVAITPPCIKGINSIYL